MPGYQIADEPAPSQLARYAVNPIYPMLAAMLAGAWLAWPWFAFNSYAIGSPTRRGELAWLAAGLVVPPLLGYALIATVPTALGLAPSVAIPYVLLAVVVAKLAVVYAVYLLQSRTIEIYEYYGGKLGNGVAPLIAGFFIRGQLLPQLPGVLTLILS